MSVRGAVRFGVDLAVGKSSNVWEFSILEGASGLASSGSFSVFLVGCNVEEDEEDEVRGD